MINGKQFKLQGGRSCDKMSQLHWGGKLRLPQRPQVFPSGDSVATAKQKLGSPIGGDRQYNQNAAVRRS